MDVIYGLIPMMLIFGFFVVVVFIWMAKTGHFDDLDGAANRIFMDDEYPEDLNKKSDKMTDVEVSSDNNLNKKEGGEKKLD
ncbi:MAG: cbb3-type cytochrome oxidase assembly protein CcoS [Thiomicrorhabdus sp.]|nr:cbb3-type cytochrome oxidase assembly protein CcoS [Thiomicrorhabdus sp.]